MHLIQRCTSSTLLLAALLAQIKHVAAAASNMSAVMPLTATAHGTALTAAITIGTQVFNLLLDTGSSDLWVLSSDWKCHEMSESGILGPTVPRKECAYGNGTYIPDRDTFTSVDDAWLGVHYGAGDVLGTLGRDDVHIGSLLLPDQVFGIANATNGPADSYSEGIMGLGYPILSQTHPQSYTAESPFELLQSTLPSQTVVLSLAEQYAESYFAFALERTPLDQETAFGGYVSFGTLPPVAHSHEWTHVPVEITKTVPVALTNNTRQRTYWTTTIDSVTWDGESYDIPYQAVVDTGNFYFIVPERLAERVASAFDPPGVYEPNGPEGPAYSVQCNATLPTSVGLELGGKMFSIDSEDTMFRDFDGKCYSTFAPTIPLEGIELFFLSSHFLRNVVAVFDYQHNEMRFAERIRNSTNPANSTSSPQPTVPLQTTNGASTSRNEWFYIALTCLLCTMAWI